MLLHIPSCLGVEREGYVPLDVFTRERWTCDDRFGTQGTVGTPFSHIRGREWIILYLEGKPPDALSESRRQNALQDILEHKIDSDERGATYQKIAGGPSKPGNKEYSIGGHHCWSSLVDPNWFRVHPYLSQRHGYWNQRNLYAPVAGRGKQDHEGGRENWNCCRCAGGGLRW